MSNVKQVHMTGRVPFDWASGLRPDDAAFMASYFLNPVIGLRLSFTEDGYEPNENGGRTAMYRFSVIGTEAIPWKALDRLADVFASVGTVEPYEALDLEDRG
jgi:hypothetical protein